MAPNAAKPNPQSRYEPEIGINAILLGPPGSGKGTQVSFILFVCDEDRPILTNSIKINKIGHKGNGNERGNYIIT